MEKPLPRTHNQAFGHLQLFETTWFPKLLISMFGSILILIIDVLWNFVASPINPKSQWFGHDTAFSDWLPWLFSQYCILVFVFSSVQMAFISVCLFVQHRQKGLLKICRPLHRYYMQLPISHRRRMKNTAWAIAILTLLTAFASYDWMKSKSLWRPPYRYDGIEVF